MFFQLIKMTPKILNLKLLKKITKRKKIYKLIIKFMILKILTLMSPKVYNKCKNGFRITVSYTIHL